jgi:hypothetical protein
VYSSRSSSRWKSWEMVSIRERAIRSRSAISGGRSGTPHPRARRSPRPPIQHPPMGNPGLRGPPGAAPRPSSARRPAAGGPDRPPAVAASPRGKATQGRDERDHRVQFPPPAGRPRDPCRASPGVDPVCIGLPLPAAVRYQQPGARVTFGDQDPPA